MKAWKLVTAVTIVGATLFVGGCNKSDSPTSASTSTPPVSLSIGFSNVSSATSLSKSTAADSIIIDSIDVVLQKIKFESHIDSVTVDTTGEMSSDDGQESNITFRGPFIIHVRDSNAVSFADQVLPAGTYTGIKFRIHRIQQGEQFEDSDEHNHRHMVGNDSIMGYSVAVWGQILKNGTWTSFSFKSNLELEFKIKGNFTITTATSTFNFVLRFNTANWFRNSDTGALLDPTDPSQTNRELINHAIRRSFERGRGGHDANDDGHPDD